jgi:hypothetical protein
MNKFELKILFVLMILAFLTYWKLLQFDVWIDDSKLMWASLYHLPSAVTYYNHPGLPLYFLLFSKFFGDRYVLWQLMGIILKVVTAFVVGKFVQTITHSSRAGVLSAMLFVTSYIGLEAISAPIMNVSAVMSVPMLLSLISFILLLENKYKYVWSFIICLIIALILDPGRMFSFLIVLPFFYLLYPQTTININKSFIVKGILFIAIISLPLFIIWFQSFVTHSQIMINDWSYRTYN